MALISKAEEERGRILRRERIIRAQVIMIRRIGLTVGPRLKDAAIRSLSTHYHQSVINLISSH